MHLRDMMIGQVHLLTCSSTLQAGSFRKLGKQKRLGSHIVADQVGNTWLDRL